MPATSVKVTFLSFSAKILARLFPKRHHTRLRTNSREEEPPDEKEEDQRRQELLQTERLLLKRENVLDEKISIFDKKETEFQDKVEKLKKVKEIIKILSEAIPDSRIALKFSNPLELLIATILSAQCTDVKVNQSDRRSL
jgi:ATP-dependent 26S proteasome regulatory subunit